MSRFLLCLFLACKIFAEWDAEYCFPDHDVSVIEDLVFKQLKQDVAHSVDRSWCSLDKARLLMDLVYITQPEVCVEIGAFSGSSVLPVVATLKYLQHGIMIAVDGWSNDVAVQNMDWDDPNRPWWSWVNMDLVYQSFLNKLDEHSLQDYCLVFPTSSEDAASMIDEIDFLHLDGDYTVQGSLQDVALYLPKVKPGGYILLSNLFTMVKGKAPKMKAFSELFNACEMICEIDRDNVVLFRKN